MRIDQLELLRLRHRVRDRAGTAEERRRVAERARRGEPGEEPRRALEERRHGSGEAASSELVERRQRDERRGHEPR